MDRKINYILLFCVAVVALLCCFSITAPLRFDSKVRERERVVARNLKAIHAAEEAYRRQHGVYTGDFRVLERSRLIADSLTRVPYSGGERFMLSADVQISNTGVSEPVMQCGALYRQYLKGLDADMIADKAEQATAEGRYPGLKIGEMDN